MVFDHMHCLSTSSCRWVFSVQGSSKIFIHPAFPYGEIEVFPPESICHYPHQGPGNRKLCLKADYKAPVDRSRLTVYVAWAKEWLEDAAKDLLLKPTDPYELPPFNVPANAAGPMVLFQEDDTSFQWWRSSPTKQGLFEFVLPSDRKTILVARFSASHGDLPLRWGSHVEDEHRGTGIWLLCSDELVVERRRAPLKWGELRPILEQEGISLRGTLLEYVARASFDAKRTLFLVGFPIPKAVAGEKVEVHWQPIFLSDWRVAPQGIRPSKHEIRI